MKSLIRLMVVSMLMFFTAPAWSGSAVHMFHCVAEDHATDDALEAITSEWLAAAKKMKGGENLEVFLYFPIATGTSEHDFSLIMITPDFAQMGAFLDAYAGSPLEEIDDRLDELAVCPISDMWEAIAVK